MTTNQLKITPLFWGVFPKRVKTGYTRADAGGLFLQQGDAACPRQRCGGVSGNSPQRGVAARNTHVCKRNEGYIKVDLPHSASEKQYGKSIHIGQMGLWQEG
ncbi:hypothetical protein [Parapedobacter indicus]|uniref:hypothetical protein n=1 Tax=Parapedobacter indicus TaxID=1477437 RepID=UPI001160BB03|nr:hypothetical protein [Parapedobacter indicus]